jgi:hypothetical protein
MSDSNPRAYSRTIHCKPGPFDKQFCMANTAIFTSYITFQSNHNGIFHSRQMWIYELLICTFRHDENFNFVNWSFSSPTSAFALCASNFQNLNSLWKHMWVSNLQLCTSHPCLLDWHICFWYAAFALLNSILKMFGLFTLNVSFNKKYVSQVVICLAF